ncbi:guanine nucleotide binding protein, alpha subunit [Infundibulicybe gibba]|nr:guanine nucleotide binding protein, alpha subunit [Infundibulicybe gibba]
MGNCISTIDRARNGKKNAIDKRIEELIEEDSKKRRREHKILLLGSSQSGKSTIVKQMKILYGRGFSDAELASFRPIIYSNVLHSAQSVVSYMRKTDLECVNDGNHALAEKILNYTLEPSDDPHFPPEIADAIHQLWKDPVIPKVMHSNKFYLMDSASYFFDEVLRIGAPGYLPNEADVLRAYLKSQGITETRFIMGQLQMHMFDVGGRFRSSEFREWIHYFEGITIASIIFCAALSEYDQVLPEEQNQNRMVESLALFEHVVNSGLFLQTSIILFLNKIDVFRNKLPIVPLERYFPEYTGGAEVNKAAKYILGRFMRTNRAQLSVYPHLTQTTDTTNVCLVFAAIRETILAKALKDSEVL